MLTVSPTDRKCKIPNYQNGHAYLTSHRICYVSVDEPRKYSVSIELKEVDRVEYQVRNNLSMSGLWSLTDIRQASSSPPRRSPSIQSQ